jgi:hypothetical protein
MLAALIVLAAPVLLDVEVSAGFALPQDTGPVTPALQLRVGADFIDHIGLGVTLLGIPGPETKESFSGCPGCGAGGASFRAISGLGSLRLHSSGDLQAFFEVGLGVGHLISLSDEDLFEDPALHGRGGFTWLAGVGGRWYVLRQFALGLSLSLTGWSRVSRPAFTYGTEDVPASSNLTAGAALVLFSVSWSPGR